MDPNLISEFNKEIEVAKYLEKVLKDQQEYIDSIQTLSLKIEKVDKEDDSINYLKLSCKKRKLLRTYITFLDNSIINEETSRIEKMNKEIIGKVKYNFTILKENSLKKIEKEDSQLRQLININPKIETVTLDYLCKIWGY
ncbi:hypothetical protein ACG9XW_22825 [Acinetobacter guillouiae]|uniref:hypothetical protein n=1 Tax=Acinetobacter guillouiae TaxID=106649 RepID=UPI003AF9BBD3